MTFLLPSPKTAFELSRIYNEDQSVTVAPMQDGVVTVTLNRPEKRNAFDGEMVEAITNIFDYLAKDESVQAIVLRGAGEDFSVGADMEWMRNIAQATASENLADAKHFAEMFDTVGRCSKPTIAVIQGKVICGGVMLARKCDKVIALAGARLQVKDLYLGLRPSTATPHMIQSIGAHNTKVLYCTCKKLTPEEGIFCGLVEEMRESDAVNVALTEATNQAKILGKEGFQSLKSIPHNLDVHLPDSGKKNLALRDAGVQNNYDRTMEWIDYIDERLKEVKTPEEWEVLKMECASDLARVRKSTDAQRLLGEFLDTKKVVRG